MACSSVSIWMQVRFISGFPPLVNNVICLSRERHRFGHTKSRMTGSTRSRRIFVESELDCSIFEFLKKNSSAGARGLKLLKICVQLSKCSLHYFSRGNQVALNEPGHIRYKRATFLMLPSLFLSRGNQVSDARWECAL